VSVILSPEFASDSACDVVCNEVKNYVDDHPYEKQMKW
jgi:hypothetical protein